MEHKSIFYSLVLIFIIPLFIFFHTFYLVNSFQDHIDTELQYRASQIAGAVEVMGRELLDEPEKLQNKLEEMSGNFPEIADLFVAVPQEENEAEFKIIAAFDQNQQGTVLTKDKYQTIWRNSTMAWSEDSSFATLREDEIGKRYWLISRPVHNAEGEKAALIGLALSLQNTDSLVESLIFNSYLSVIVFAVIVIVLVANHARLFEYAALYRRLKEVSKIKDELVSASSHDLKTPISAIKAFLGLMKEGTYGEISAKAKQGIEKMLSSLDHLSRMVEDLLSVSEIQQNKIRMEQEKLNPAEVVRQVVDSFSPQASRKGLELRIQEESEKKIKVDRKRFRQIITNLVENAIKYTLEGEIEVRIFSSENQVKVAVQDSGIGISAEEQKQLFQKFSRLSAGKKTGEKGTGLGLWITKRLVSLMDGEISVESIKGEGSKFTVSFPRVDRG